MKRGLIKSVHTIGLIGVSFVAVACGAPNLSAMHPQVKKPTAAVLLVDQPAGWNVSSVQDMVTQSGIMADVRNVTSGQLDTALNPLAGNSSIGLIVVVRDGPISQSEFDTAKQSIGHRFEFVGTQALKDTAVNIKQVVPDPLAACYSLGWLAGQLGLRLGAQSVGWVTDGTAECTPDQVKSALIGAYSANSAFQVVPLNMTSLNLTVPMPKLAVTPRTLSDQELQTLTNAGTTVISLSAQPATALAGKPVLPDMSVVQPDFSAVSHMNWQSGTVTTSQPPVVWTNSNAVPADLTNNVTNVEAGLQNSHLNVQASWQRVPQPIRQLWSQVPGTASP